MLNCSIHFSFGDLLFERKQIREGDMRLMSSLILVPIQLSHGLGSSETALDTSMKIQSEITTLQSELDRILYLLKIADPSGEAAQRRDAKPLVSKSDEPTTLTSNKIPKKSPSDRRKEKGNSEKPVATMPSQIIQAENPTEKGGNAEERESKTPPYVPTKPLFAWCSEGR